MNDTPHALGGPDDTRRPVNPSPGGNAPPPEGAPVSPTASRAPARESTRPTRATHAGVPPALEGHPRYEILERLGSGGMGTVYKARHRLMDRVVALKVINPALVGWPEAVRRFRQEIRAAARLTHPNIVAAYDAEQAGDTHFLV